jgi:hypothetical protein
MSWLAVGVQCSLGREAGIWLHHAPPVLILSPTQVSLNLSYWNQEQCASCNALVLLLDCILLCCNTVQSFRWTLAFQGKLVFVTSEFILKTEATGSLKHWFSSYHCVKNVFLWSVCSVIHRSGIHQVQGLGHIVDEQDILSNLQGHTGHSPTSVLDHGAAAGKHYWYGDWMHPWALTLSPDVFLWNETDFVILWQISKLL